MVVAQIAVQHSQYLNALDNALLLVPKVMPYKSFKKVLDKGPFNLIEWASLLQLSERTLQRYAKDQISFNTILAERIHFLSVLIDEGHALFGDSFKQWLHSKPVLFKSKTPYDYLFTHDGITFVFKTMKQMQLGISI
jgi:uncharacterized protein (DUF2384 family)